MCLLLTLIFMPNNRNTERGIPNKKKNFKERAKSLSSRKEEINQPLKDLICLLADVVVNQDKFNFTEESEKHQKPEENSHGK